MNFLTSRLTSCKQHCAQYEAVYPAALSSLTCWVQHFRSKNKKKIISVVETGEVDSGVGTCRLLYYCFIVAHLLMPCNPHLKAGTR